MPDDSEKNHSQHEANKAIRVLSGKPLKYTVRIIHPNNKVTEFQSENQPKLKYLDDARCLYLVGGDYTTSPIMRWDDGFIMLVEENPKP